YPNRIEKILAEGLDPAFALQGAGTLPGLDKYDPRPKIWLTDSRSYGAWYAEMAAKTQAMQEAKAAGKNILQRLFAKAHPTPPIRVELPDDFQVHRLPGWAVPLGSQEYYVTEKIPPQFLRRDD